MIKNRGFFWKSLLAGTAFAACLPQLSFHVLHPLSLTWFESGENILKKEGWNSTILKDIAGDADIRVRRDTLLGKAHAVLDFGIRDAHSFRYADIEDPANIATSIPSYLDDKSPALMKMLGVMPAICPVYFPNNKGGNDSSKRVSEKEAQMVTLMHEFRHCGTENQAITDDRISEADAEYVGIMAVADHYKNPHIIEHFFNQSALQLTGKDHDMVLFLEALIQKKPLPDIELVEAANEEALTYRDSIVGSFKECAANETPADLCVMPEVAENISPLANHRLNLFTQGYRFFYKMKNG